MTVTQAITNGTKRLSAKTDSARLDAELLLAKLLKVDRPELVNIKDQVLTDDQEQNYFGWVSLRADGRPVAYFTNTKDFYGFRLHITDDVLVPRPASELLVDEVLRRVAPNDGLTVADIGTGSGAIALALSTSLPQSRVIATDVSAQALSVAHYNIRHNNLTDRVTFVHGSLLEPFDRLPSPDIIVANLPYLRTDQLSEKSISHEPTLALDGGADGLDLVWKLIDQLPSVHPFQGLLLELDPAQIIPVTNLLTSLWPQYTVEPISDGQADRGVVMWAK